MNDKTNMLLMSFSKYFPEESLMMIREKFENMDESKTSMLYTLSFKDPMTALILSIVAGPLGIDRFYIGDTGLEWQSCLHVADAAYGHWLTISSL